MKSSGPWKLTSTVHGDRCNLFCLSPRNEYHIATIISGSKEQVDRFEACLKLIEAAPEMKEVLEGTLSLLNDFGFVQSPRAKLTAESIRGLLDRIDADSFASK